MRKVYLRAEVEEFFESMDRDFDGQLSFEEFMGEESTIEKMFKNLDKNGDGVVNRQVHGNWNLEVNTESTIKRSVVYHFQTN